MSAPMVLTRENYFSPEANRLFMSNSQYGNWKKCAAKQFAIENEIYEEVDDKNHFIGGRYAHTAVLLPEELEQFEIDNPSVKKTLERSVKDWKDLGAKLGVDLKGKMKSRDTMREAIVDAGHEIPPEPRVFESKFAWIETALEGYERQQVFVDCIDKGKSEIIYTFQLGGIWWKCMIDNLRIQDNQFDDLKFMADFKEKWDNKKKRYVQWFEVYDYERQSALYQFGIKENENVLLTPNIFGLSKQKPSMPSWIQFTDQQHLDGRIKEVEENLVNILAWKSGERPAPRCEQPDCDFCRATAVIERPLRPTYSYAPTYY